MRKKLSAFRLFIILFPSFTIFTAGCRAPMPDETINIPESYAEKMTTKDNGSGFRAGWADYSALRNYDKLWIECKLSVPMTENTWWENFNSRRLFYSRTEDNEYVDEYATETFRKAILKSPNFTPAIMPEDKTLKIEIYITQIVANKIVLGTLSNLIYPTPIGLFIILPLKLVLQSSMGNQGGSIAIEAIIKDSQTEEILAVFVSKEKGATAIFDSNRFFAYANLRNIVNVWSIDLISMLDQVKECNNEPKPTKTLSSFIFIRIIAD